MATRFCESEDMPQGAFHVIPIYLWGCRHEPSFEFLYVRPSLGEVLVDY